MIRALLLLTWLFILAFFPSKAQFSFGLQAGYVSAMEDNPDAYGLNKKWPTASDQSIFFYKGTGSSITGTAFWEITPHFGIGLAYRSVSFNMSENQRSASHQSFGLQFKLNFVKNTKNIVPFVQASYLFSNSNSLHQTAATSIYYPTQKQPGFDESYSVYTGVGLDLGTEIKLSQPFSIVIQGGVHGIDLSESDKGAFISKLDYGTYPAPKGIDGVFYPQFSGGIKYYLGKGMKKRDY